MKENKENKISISRIIITMIMLVVVIVGGTYAWYTYQSNKTTLVLNIGDLNDSRVTIKPYQIRDTMTPVNVYTSGVYSQIDVVNSNSGKMIMTLFYKVNSLNEELINNGFKYTIASSNTKDGEYTEVLTGDFTTLGSEKQIEIFDTRINGSTNIYYRVYLWLDSSFGDQSELQNVEVNIELNARISRDANAPILDDGMIPVTLSNSGVATTIASDDEDWYDYSKKKWANIVLVSESSRSNYFNTENVVVNSADILAYYVWIPRYKYKIWTNGISSTGNEQSIEIMFETDGVSAVNGNGINEYKTHPAFWWDINSDGTMVSSELVPGIWVGKFETTGDVTTPTVLPNASSLVNQNVSTQFTTSLKFAGGTLNNGEVSFVGSNTYGIGATTDTHMMKNSEWGAVAYLSHSSYGINDEIRINNNGVTGYGSSSEGQIAYGSGVTSYPQSTTGNITGVFDMSGGSYEHVMGVLSDSSGNPRSGNNSSNNSGFNGLLSDNTSYTEGIPFPNSKYYDLYLQSQFSGNYLTNLGLCTLETCGGHALDETSAWYSDINYFASSSSPWLIRGGLYNEGSSAGVFMSNADYGIGDVNTSWRSVFVVLDLED